MPSSFSNAFSRDFTIDWYRSPVEPSVLTTLMKRSDLRGAAQTGLHLGWFFTTGAMAYGVFLAAATNAWLWLVLPFALFLHGTMGPFMGLIAIHELQHRTVFKTRWLNVFFEQVYAFISWSDYIWYQQSHAIHHQATCHGHHDGEVVLPVKFSLTNWRTWLGLLAWDPRNTWQRLALTWRHARGDVQGDWYRYVLPEEDHELRRRHRNWARTLLLGHGALALMFVATGNCFLIVVFTFGTQYCAWLGFLCGVPQYCGLESDVPDFRRNTRTFTCSPVVGFYYWNMQYHVEHHMYPAVPFHALPQLHEAIKGDLPPTPHGLRNTWRDILELRHRALAAKP